METLLFLSPATISVAAFGAYFYRVMIRHRIKAMEQRVYFSDNVGLGWACHSEKML